MKKFFSEFKKFISRGNVVDLAVGMIIGSAFTAIVTALSNGILKPLINWLIAVISGGNDALASAVTFLKKATLEDGTIDLANSIYIDWGALISAIINFLLIAIVLFCIVKAFNKVKEAGEKTANIVSRAQFKQSKGLKLSKKEEKALKEKEEQDKLALEKAEQEKLVAEQEASKLTKTEELLTQIKLLLETKQ